MNTSNTVNHIIFIVKQKLDCSLDYQPVWPKLLGLENQNQVLIPHY